MIKKVASFCFQDITIGVNDNDNINMQTNLSVVFPIGKTRQNSAIIVIIKRVALLIKHIGIDDPVIIIGYDTNILINYFLYFLINLLKE